MLTVSTVADLRKIISDWKDQGDKIAFVPTMGNLHIGHLALVKHAHECGDKVVCSIFVNSLQFDREEDLQTGKRTLAVRAGVGFGRLEVAACLLGPHLAGLAWFATPYPATALWPLLTAPLALAITLMVFRTPPSQAYNRFLGMAALHLLLHAGLVTGALLSS